ncbi:Kelch-like protein 36 [Tupaia chinensis]|uniref:Kelch-like protein 36 n=1 Tax=Tupaia chinensis TaxID=246437 RepID=L9KJM1_TUPCH|nr:Kelch-like protein 36 [Tupaia chinensis]
METSRQTRVSRPYKISESSKVASMNQRRVDFYLASIEDMLVAVGGRNENGALSSVETYSPKTDSWSYVAGLPSSEELRSVSTAFR